MEIKQFIEKAIEGGWKPEEDTKVRQTGAFVEYISFGKWVPCHLEEILLDPLAWQAVGKVRDWGTEMVLIDEVGHPKEWMFFEHCDRCGATINDPEEGCPNYCVTDNAPIPEWQHNMHRMIDALAEGKSITEFLETL